MSPRLPKDTAPAGQAPQDPQPVTTHEPAAFESDLDRHRASVDEVYGSHGVQPEPGEAVRPSEDGRFSRRLSRVGDRRRR